MLTSRTLESFIEVAKKKNIKTASTSLNLTASPVSRRIKILENWVGFKLFVRMQNDFVLTEKGRAFYEDILPYHEQMAVLEKTYRSKKCDENKIKSLKIGIELLSQSVIKKFIEYFRGNKEVNHVLYYECNKDSALDKLLAEDIELLFSHRVIRHERISFMELNSEPLWLTYHNDLERKIKDKSIGTIFIIEQKTIDQDNLNKISNYICTSFPNADILIVNSFTPYLNLIESGNAVFIINETSPLAHKQSKNAPVPSPMNKMKVNISLKTHVYFLKKNEDISRQLAEIV